MKEDTICEKQDDTCGADKRLWNNVPELFHVRLAAHVSGRK